MWVQWDVSSGGNGHWYKPVPGFSGLTWTIASQQAQAEGGYLATITSAAENAFVFSLVANDPQYWRTDINYSGPALGGLQQEGAPEPAGGWYWISGEPWTYSNWYPGQPDNWRWDPWPPGEDRLHFFGSSGQWNDLPHDDFNLGGYVIERGVLVNIPVVSTLPPDDVTKTSATLNGSVTDDVGEACQYRFRYKEEKGDYVYTSWAGSVTSGQSFSEPISDLKHNRTYYFNAQAKNSAGESEWGNEQSFVSSSDWAPVLKIVETKRSFGNIGVLSNPGTTSNLVQLEAQFSPSEPIMPIGRYEWSIVRGDDKVQFLGGDNSGIRVVVKPIAESTSRNDVEIKVKFTSYSSVPSCEAFYQMTVLKPTFLKVVEGFPEDPKIYYNSQGGVVGYDVDYAFQVYDQLYPAEPIPVKGMRVVEWMDISCRSQNIFLPKAYNYASYWTNESGIWEEVLAPHHTLIKTIPENFIMKVDQNIYVEGWHVGTRCQTYHYNYATSEEGNCTGGCD